MTEFTVITSVYRDPLEFCMEGIEEMARKILRTGKLTINGEPGGVWFGGKKGGREGGGREEGRGEEGGREGGGRDS